MVNVRECIVSESILPTTERPMCVCVFPLGSLSRSFARQQIYRTNIVLKTFQHMVTMCSLHICAYITHCTFSCLIYREAGGTAECAVVYELLPKRNRMKAEFLSTVLLHFTKLRSVHQILEMKKLDESFINNFLENDANNHTIWHFTASLFFLLHSS